MQRERIIVTEAGYSFQPFDQHKCIFVHVPKTAGVSVARSLFGNLAGGHTPLEKYQIIFSKNEYENYFKFTFVRNPWDRLVSAYSFLRNGGFDEQDRLWAQNNLSSYNDFDGFVKGWVRKRNIESKIHFMPQYKFVCEPMKFSPGVNYIGYFENLEDDYYYIRNMLGIKASLPHLNSTERKKDDYRNFYTEETKKIVADVYMKDIQIFGYDFDNTKHNRY
jgi:hypothetical protein